MTLDVPEPLTRWLEEQTALNFWLWVGAIWAVLTLTWRTIRRAVPAIKRLIALSESLERLPAWMDEIDRRIDAIQANQAPTAGGDKE